MILNRTKLGSLAKKILKVVGITCLVVACLLIVLSLLIQVPFVQKKIVTRAVSFVHEKIGTPVSLGHFRLQFPKQVVLEDVYFEDQSQDTLLYAGRIMVNTDLFALVSKRIELNDVEIEDLTARVHRFEDSTFNFDYIIDAFASGKNAPKDTTQEGWSFAPGNLLLQKIDVSFKDAAGGNDIAVILGELEAGIEEFDLEKKNIGIGDVALVDVKANITMRPTAESVGQKSAESQSPDSSYNVSVESLHFSSIAVDYLVEQQSQLTLSLKELDVEANTINLRERHIDLDQLVMKNAFVAYHVLDSTVKEQPQQESTPSTSNPWIISAEKIDLAQNSFQYYDFSKPRVPGVDFNHLWLSQFSLQAEDIQWQEDQMNGVLNVLTFRERSGFSVDRAQGEFAMDDSRAFLKDFEMATGRSSVHADIEATYTSLKSLSGNLTNTEVDATISDTYMAVADVLLFQPHLLNSVPVTLPTDARVNFEAEVSGTIGELAIAKLDVNTLSDTRLSLTGNVHGLPDVREANANLELRTFHTSRGDVKAILQDTLLPASVRLPEWIDISGRLQGSMYSPRVETILKSEFGNINVNASLDADTSFTHGTYKGSLDIRSFDLGRLLGQAERMGKLDVDASVEGSGLSSENLDAALKVKVNSFEYQQYVYRDLVVDGQVVEYLFSGEAYMNDPNLSFNLKGDLDYNFDTRAQEYHFKFELANADFNALHLSERPLKARFTIDVDLDNADVNNLNGSIDIRKVAVYNGERLYKVDSLLFASVRDSTKTELTINSDIIAGSFKGSFDLPRLPQVLTDFFSSYYRLHDKEESEYAERQYFTFELDIKNTSLLTEVLLPDLKRFVPGPIRGEFDSDAKTLLLEAKIEEIEYASTAVYGVDFKAEGDKDRLTYALESGNIDVNIIHVPALSFRGIVQNDVVNTSLIVYDSLDKEKYVIGANFQSKDQNYQLHLNPDSIRLNYDPWQIPEGNYLQFGPSGLEAHQLELSNGAERITLETKAEPDSTLTLSFDQLDLRSLTSIITSRDTLLSGVVNGGITMFQEEDQGAMEANVNISELSMNSVLLGDVKAHVTRRQGNQFNAKLTIHGPGTDVNISGAYRSVEGNMIMDVKGVISSLNLAAVQPLTFGQAKEMQGNIAGDFTVNGPIDQPAIDGRLRFQDVSLVPAFTKSKLVIKDETLRLNPKGLSFRNFRILDANGNAISLNGSVETPGYRRAVFDLRVTASDFLLLNTEEGDSELFYGKVRVNTNTRVTGDHTQPIVSMEVSLSEGSNFTYIVPAPEIGVMEQEGIVKFVDKDAASDPFLSSIQKEEKTSMDTLSTFKGLVLSANIELNDNETFNIVIDPVTKDQLTVKGNTTLTLDIDHTGNVNLAGRYELSEGTYSLTFYKLIKRTFDIEKGSTIIWSGDPLDATLDIDAVYTVETSPLDLVSNQLTGNTQQEINQYKQPLPFLVYLSIEGTLLSPDISFSLDMPENKRNAFGGNVYARLQDINSRESELNKQVFALLILKRFMSDNPFENQGGETLGSTARRSVSRLLSEQLNRLSEKIEGIELSFDLKSFEEYSSGKEEERTQLELGVSKSLLDDRLVVKLSGNVNLEGGGSQESISDYVGDLALEYKLTEDGRLRITGFRNSDYTMIDGELIETGVGLIYIKDYDSLKELFKPNVKKEK